MISADENSAEFYQWGVVIGASLIAALWDIKCRRIPNVLTLPLLAAGLLQAAMFSGWDGLKSALFAMMILALPYVLLFLFAGGGAGDAKLMAAVGAWLGIKSGIVALVAISLCAIALALLKAASKQRFFEVLKNIRDMMIAFILFVKVKGWRKAGTEAIAKDPGEELMTMPYAPAIFAGLVVAAVYSGLKY
jgi:Flp pilus assembly protein protease CpaA